MKFFVLVLAQLIYSQSGHGADFFIGGSNSRCANYVYQTDGEQVLSELELKPDNCTDFNTGWTQKKFMVNIGFSEVTNSYLGVYTTRANERDFLHIYDFKTHESHKIFDETEKMQLAFDQGAYLFDGKIYFNISDYREGTRTTIMAYDLKTGEFDEYLFGYLYDFQIFQHQGVTKLLGFEHVPGNNDFGNLVLYQFNNKQRTVIKSNIADRSTHLAIGKNRAYFWKYEVANTESKLAYVDLNTYQLGTTNVWYNLNQHRNAYTQRFRVSPTDDTLAVEYYRTPLILTGANKSGLYLWSEKNPKLKLIKADGFARLGTFEFSSDGKHLYVFGNEWKDGDPVSFFFTGFYSLNVQSFKLKTIIEPVKSKIDGYYYNFGKL